MASRNTPGRVDPPFVGLATFARQPACTDWDALDGADVGVLGIPIDTASSYRSGARFAPRAIREASMFHSFGPEGVFDFEDGATYLAASETRIVDAGDSAVSYADARTSLTNAEHAVRALLDAAVFPFILGGDHSVTIAAVSAFSNLPPVHIVHLDAHLDFVDGRDGARNGHGCAMRRASEMDHVSGITTLGPRNMGAVGRSDYEDALRYGVRIVSARQLRMSGVESSLAHIPSGDRVYVSIDIDVFDPSIAPGTGTISHGGLSYYEGVELLEGIASRFDVIGADMVEVCPSLDPTGITSLLAARLGLDLLGAVFKERRQGS